MPASIFTSFDQLPVMLNATDIAAVLGISKVQAYTLIHRGDFPTICIGKRYIVPRDHFVEWINAAASKAPENAGLNGQIPEISPALF